MPQPTPDAGKSASKLDAAAAKKLAAALKAMDESAKKVKVATSGADAQASELDKVK